MSGLYPGPPEKGGLELGPTRNQARAEPEFEFSAKRRWSVSNVQPRLRPFDQIPVSRTGGLEKRGRIGRVKERKERGKGREVNEVSCSPPVRALWLVVCVRRRPGTKGSQLRPLGLVHWQASWPLSTPSGQDVRRSEEESLPESPFVAGRGAPSRARNWENPLFFASFFFPLLSSTKIYPWLVVIPLQSLLCTHTAFFSFVPVKSPSCDTWDCNSV